jgi:hypothetical protein
LELFEAYQGHAYLDIHVHVKQPAIQVQLVKQKYLLKNRRTPFK